MENEHSKYYKTLRELTGEAKFETLSVVQFGNAKIQEFFNNMPALAKLVKDFAPITEVFSSIRPATEVFESIKKYLADLLALSKEIHSLPAEGWYLSVEFIDELAISNLGEYLRNNPQDFETDVIAVFERQLDYIERKLKDRNKKRAHLVATIFDLHRKGVYDAVIPLALAQADGISKEFFFLTKPDGSKVSVGFFDLIRRGDSKQSGQRLADVFDVPETDVFSILYNQLAGDNRNNSLVLEGNTARLSDLNRHSIVHGESVDFGSKVNSIKAILLLDFIDDLRIMDQILKEKF